MSNVCKIVFNGDIRRMVLPKDVPFDRLKEDLEKFYPKSFEHGITIRYRDDENDLVTVTSNMELVEAFDMENTLRLLISSKTPKQSCPSENKKNDDGFTDVDKIVDSGSDSEDFVKVSKDGQRTSTVSKTDTKLIEAKIAEATKQAAKKADQLLAVRRAEEAKAKTETERKAAEAKARAEAAAKAKDDARKKAELEAEAAANARIKFRAKRNAKLAAQAKAEARKKTKQLAALACAAARKAKEAEGKFLSKLSSKFIEDVTIPDEAELEVGTQVVKTWLVRNDGEVAWPKGTALVKMTRGGKLVGRVEEFKVPELAPGSEADISVQISVPGKPSLYRSPSFTLALEGKPFGDSFWAIIKAVRPAKSPVSAKRGKGMIPDKQNQDDVKAKRSGPITKSVVMDSKFVSDLTIPDGMLVAPGQALTKKWLVKNSGCFPWPAGTVLALAKSTKFTSVSHASTDSVVYPGTTAELEVALTAPAETGKHLASFQLWRLEDNKPFGDEFWASVEVVKFPSVGQLKKLALDFIADSKNVAILQSELPALLSDLSNGRRLAVIVDSLLERNPSLLNQQFFVFLRPFLHSAESFMSLQLKVLVGMYSLLAKTPLVAGASFNAAPEPRSDSNLSNQLEEKSSDAGVSEKALPPVEEKEDAKPEKSSDIDENNTADRESSHVHPALRFLNKTRNRKTYRWVRELKAAHEMGIEDLNWVKKLLKKHRGNLDAVLDEMFNKGA